MECTSDLDLEEIESRLYSQVFHSTEDWESDTVTPNMILNDMSNRHVSNYTVNNVTHSNANRYWCGQNAVMIPPQTMRPVVPYNHVPNKKMFENEDRQEQLQKNRELRRQLKRQRKQNRRREKKLAKKINSILVNNSATVDNDKYCNNPAAKSGENGVNTSYNSGMFADDSIIYQRIDVPSLIHEPGTENVTSDDVQLPVMQQLVSSTSNVVNDNDADVIVLSDDSDSDSVMEVPLPPAPIYTVDSSNDSDTSVSSKKSQVIAMISAAPDVNVSAENSLLGSNEKSMETSHDKNVIENVEDELNTSLILVENTSDNKELETVERDDDLEIRDDTSIVHQSPKPTDVANSSDIVGITEEERTALLYSPDSNTNDFIANDVDNMNKNVWGFNFMLHGSDLDLPSKDPEKLNRTSGGVPSTDIYETESSCSEAGTFISKAPVFHEIDFESPTKEIFCEPNLTSFSKFITPVRKTKSMDANKTNPRLGRVKTKALSLIERTSKQTTKDAADNDKDGNTTTDEYNSDATMLQVKKKSKKKKKNKKKNKDKLNSEVDSEMVDEVNANSEPVVNIESRKSNSKNETDNKIVESEKSKKSSNKNTNDEKSFDKDRSKKSSNKSEDDDKHEKNENKNKKQLKTTRDLTVNSENSEKIIQHDDMSVGIEKSGSSDKIKNKRPKKLSSRDIPGDSLNSDMNIETITEQQTTSQLPSKIGNEFSFVETLNKIEHKSEEESAEGKIEIREENTHTMENDIGKGTLVIESSSGENGGLKRFSFVGTWNKLNQQSTENQESSASEVNLNKSTEQNTSIECNQTTDQDPLTCSNRNKSTEPLNEYISFNLIDDHEKITVNLESSKAPKDVEIEINQTYTSPGNNLPQTLKSNDSKNRNKNIQHSPSEGPGSSSSKKPKKSERVTDVIVLSSDSDLDTECNPRFKFYKDLNKDITENFMLNTSPELDKSFDINAAGTSNSNVRISKYNLVVNPFSVGKMKKSFKDYWTSDMAMFYDESWGQENYDIQQVLSSMPSDKSKWKIISEDQRPSRQSRKRGPVCMRCREPGHPQYRCTRYPGPIKCSTCGCSGHAHTRCPNLMCTTCGNKGGYHTTSCYKCAHYARIRCNVCNMSGHLNTNCPDLWRRYHLTTEDTLYLSSSQTSLKPITQRWCSNCARRGHFQDACPYSNFEHFPTINRIMSYDPVYNRNTNFLTSKPEEENIPMLPNTTLSDIRNYKDTIIEHNNKKYENILKTLRRQCIKSNLQYVDQINKIEKSLRQNQFSRKNIGNIYKIRSLIQKHARD
ncbi:Zinc finger CCHC-type containing 7 [Carabus blaptoides fortunei]